MTKEVIGRKEERKLLMATLTTKKSEFVAVVGRRRVGKTYLIKQTFKEYMDFHLTGMQLQIKLNNCRTFSLR